MLPKIWVGIFFAERTAQGKDFELIVTIKMETRHLGSNQQLVCAELPYCYFTEIFVRYMFQLTGHCMVIVGF